MSTLGKPLVMRNGQLEFSGWINNAGSGDWVLLIHGFPDSPITWQQQVPAMVAAGYRTLVVTCRGYESSSQPLDDDYYVASLATDVPAWLDSAGIDGAHIVGHDWGANIAFAAAVCTPERCLSLTLMSVPHPARLAAAMTRSLPQLWRSRYIVGFQFAGAEAKIYKNNFAYLERLWRRWSPDWEIPTDMMASVKERFALRGVVAAALAYYRQGTDTKSERGRISRQIQATSVSVPTLGLCGAEDACISADIFQECMQAADFKAGLTVDVVSNAGHFLHLQQPEQINQRLLTFFASF